MDGDCVRRARRRHADRVQQLRVRRPALTNFPLPTSGPTASGGSQFGASDLVTAGAGRHAGCPKLPGAGHFEDQEHHHADQHAVRPERQPGHDHGRQDGRAAARQPGRDLCQGSRRVLADRADHDAGHRRPAELRHEVGEAPDAGHAIQSARRIHEQAAAAEQRGLEQQPDRLPARRPGAGQRGQGDRSHRPRRQRGAVGVGDEQALPGAGDRESRQDELHRELLRLER